MQQQRQSTAVTETKQYSRRDNVVYNQVIIHRSSTDKEDDSLGKKLTCTFTFTLTFVPSLTKQTTEIKAIADIILKYIYLEYTQETMKSILIPIQLSCST